MWRVLIYLVAIVAAAFLCILVVEQQGVVTLTLGSRVYETSLGVALAALLVGVLILYAVFRLLKFLFLLPVSAFSLSRSRRQAKAHAAIRKGLVAAASGDLVAASRHAQAAERLAGHEPLALLLKAQAAQLHGNRAAAKEAFARMTRIADTRGLGLRGLFVEARRRGDDGDAARHAAQATELDVFLPWAHEATLLAQCRARDWQAALATLERNHRLGAMEAGDMRRAKAALLAARALDLRRAEPREALQAAMRALSLEPGLTPAATTAASLLVQDGRQRKAARIIEAAWRIAPHPELAEAYLGLQPAASAAERAKQMAKLASLKPEHEESRVAQGQSLFAARQFTEARAALAPLANAKPTARVCLLMAEIEEAENGMTGLVREWLARAAHAPRDPAWIADGAISAHWAAVEPETGRIGTYVWEHLPQIVPPPETSRVPVPAPVKREALAPPRPTLVAEPRPADAAPLIETKAAAVNVEPVPVPLQAEPHRDAAMASGPLEDAAAPGAPSPAFSAGDPPKSAPVMETPRAASPPSGPLAAPPQPAKIESVAFPLARAPDDPGAEKPRGKGLWQRLTG